jgi:hypothetical protein
MKNRLRNVTVTLNEEAARWARMEAAREDTSVSRLLGRMLEERMEQQDEYAKAMKRALARDPFLKTDGKYLSREEANSRGVR